MIKWLLKYSVVIFLFNTILLSIDVTRSFANQVFFVLMFVYAMFLMLNPALIKNIIFHKAFNLFLILNGINIFYFFCFHSFNDIEAIQYLLARIVQFSIISISIYFNYDFYKDYFLTFLVYVISAVVVLGLMYNIDIFSDRYSGIIWNPNMLCSFTSIAFAILFLDNKTKNKFDIIILTILFLVTIATGSRGALVAITLAFIFKYGLTYRNILYGIMGLGFYFIVVDFQFDTSINRFASQSLFHDRLLQYQYAYETLIQKPFIGFGLDKYAYINTALIPDHLSMYNISAHNGYLAILTQYGMVVGGVILYFILSKSLLVFNYFRKSKKIEKTYLFILFYALFASIYEALMTGINEFHTILFWFSIAFLLYTRFNKENAI